MKPVLAIAIGVSMLATAGATGMSGLVQQPAASNATAVPTVLSHLSADETKVLHDKYRYYPSSDLTPLRAPI